MPTRRRICGLYKRLTFSVIRPHDGQPVMIDDTAYFPPFETEAAAAAAAEVVALASPVAQAFFEPRVFWDAKRPINNALLPSLSLEMMLRATSSNVERRWRKRVVVLFAGVRLNTPSCVCQHLHGSAR